MAHRPRSQGYSVVGGGPRPTALILHGSKGLDAHLEAYERYARDLAAAGVDALLFSYYRPEDMAAINGAPNASVRERYYARSADRWVSVVRAVAKSTRGSGVASANVGLLGFSLGGFVAVAAASEPLFSVVTTFYAGLPEFYDHPIKSLPPLLDIHGDADRSVPLSQGLKLVAAAKHLGGVADVAVFRNEGHGFDLDPANRNASRARQRDIAFTTRWLVGG